MLHHSNTVANAYTRIRNATRHHETTIAAQELYYKGELIISILKEGNTYHIQTDASAPDYYMNVDGSEAVDWQ